MNTDNTNSSWVTNISDVLKQCLLAIGKYFPSTIALEKTQKYREEVPTLEELKKTDPKNLSDEDLIRLRWHGLIPGPCGLPSKPRRVYNGGKLE